MGSCQDRRSLQTLLSLAAAIDHRRSGCPSHWSCTRTGPCPSTPEVREIARRLYRSTAELPLVCMHGHVEAADLADDQPFADPAQLLVVPDHYVTRMLVSQGVPPEQLGVPRVDGGPTETDSAADLAAVLQPLAPLPRHAVAVLARARARRGVRRDRAAERGERRPHLRPDRRPRIAEPDFRRLALLDRFRIEVLATTDAATSDLAAPRPARGRRPRRAAWSRPSARTPSCTSRTPGWRDDVAALGAPGGHRHRHLQGLPRGAAAAAAGVRGGGRAGHRPRAPDRRHHAAARRGGGADLRGGARRHRHAPPRRRRSPPTCCSRWPRCPARTAWSCRSTPACCATTTAASPPTFGADKGFDIPVPVDFTTAPAPGARGLRAQRVVPDDPLHDRRDDVLPRARPPRRALPVGAAGRALVVPRRPRRHAPVPRGGHRDGRLLQHLGLRRRHPRVRLDPGPPRPGPPHRRRPPRPPRRRAPARRGRGGRDGRRPRLHPAQAGLPAPADRPCTSPATTGPRSPPPARARNRTRGPQDHAARTAEGPRCEGASACPA